MKKPYQTENDLVDLFGVTRVSYAKYDVEYVYLHYYGGREDELTFEHGEGREQFNKIKEAIDG